MVEATRFEVGERWGFPDFLGQPRSCRIKDRPGFRMAFLDPGDDPTRLFSGGVLVQDADDALSVVSWNRPRCIGEARRSFCPGRTGPRGDLTAGWLPFSARSGLSAPLSPMARAISVLTADSVDGDEGALEFEVQESSGMATICGISRPQPSRGSCSLESETALDAGPRHDDQEWRRSARSPGHHQVQSHRRLAVDGRRSSERRLAPDFPTQATKASGTNRRVITSR